ncbi:MAG TPA: biosynthetic arginine decarboxylase [Bdellovibrionales bacterium]|nr:biosynthetic arginine decarboxylase [Bdellovibrionales bacterium]
MTEWNTRKSAELYGINYWGANFFRINDQGNVEVKPAGTNGPGLDLYNLVQDLQESGIRMPILLRFPDIIKARIELLCGCFARAIEEAKYGGVYRGVYPIKVNQQKHLVEEILEFGQFHRFGLEAGSKPELLISLAQMDTPNALIICNGFKDQEYIEMALISQKLGRHTFIVVDRFSELSMIIQASKRLNIRPNIGFRAKLNTPGSGRWSETSGAKSKFGLTPSEIVRGVEMLRGENMLDCLQLMHFHIGSQIPSIQAIKAAIKEGARFFAEIYAMGANLKFIDVGGGLGVDYDGSGRSDSSTNYSEQEYANDIVAVLQSICDEKKIPHPDIISESGRALVAHSTALVFDVLGHNEVTLKEYTVETPDKESRLVQDLWDIYRSLSKENVNEYYNDLIEKKRDTLQLFTYGVLSLEQRAKAEDLFRAIATKIVSIARQNPELEDIRYSLEQELSDSYFCNFSVFQSLPDSWALDQLFPIMPIHRLAEQPERRAVLVDITCDSDGNITNFIDTETGGEQKYLEVHKLKHGQPYYLCAFLTGAYQEILGDLHNLFGDTDAVHVSLTENGYAIDHVVEGDDIKEVLEYVEYHRPDLLERVRKATESSILKGTISRSEARLLLEHYERGLSSYTYLTEESAMPFFPQKKELNHGANNGNGSGTDHAVHQQELSTLQRG